MSSDQTHAALGAAEDPGGNKAEDSGSSSKVNAVWQQLKSTHAGQKTQGVNFNKLWHGFSSDSMQGTAKARAARPTAEPGTYQAQLIERAAPRKSPESAPTQTQQQQQQLQQHHQQTPPAVSAKPDAETALQLVARCVAGLKDSSQAARRKALQDVQTQILDNSALSEQWLAERLQDDGLGKALLRRFDDPADSCREAAVTCLLALLRAAPQAVLSLLPYAFPVVSERVRHREEGSKNLTEPCEEVRLALARLLRALVALGGKSFGGYAGEAVEAVAALAEDPFHAVQEEACGVVLDMNEVLGLRLQPVAKKLVAALLPLTTAKRHRVRIAALQAIRPTMHQGAHEMILEMVAWRDPNVVPIKAFYGDDLKVNFCGKLAADPHPAVRREFLAVLADWMTGLRERLDHESRLLPYVLSALNDEAPEIQSDGVALLERLGAQYEQDHEKDLKDTLSYLPEEAHGIGWQAPGAAGYAYGAVAAGEETVNGGRAVFVLPGPLRSRPRLGTRRLVQSNFGRIVGALAAEVGGWMLEARRRAAALLRTQLVLAEEWSEQHLHVLLPALCRAISDPEVRPLIRDCCAVIGAFTDPELAMQLLLPRLADETAEAGLRAAGLEVMAGVVRGAGPRRAMDAQLGPLLELMAEGHSALLTCEDTRVRRALLEVVEQVLAACGPACDRHTATLLWICLHLRAPGHAPLPGAAPGVVSVAQQQPQQQQPGRVMAAAAAAVGGAAGGDAAVEAAASGAAVESVLLPRLAEVCGYGGGVDEMVEAHRRELLERLHPDSSPNVLLATGVLSRLILPHSSLSYLLYLPEELLGRVLLPEPPLPTAAAVETATAMELYSGAVCGADATPMEQEEASASGGHRSAPQPHWHWHGASTAAVLSHLRVHLATWLPRQPRCAAMCLLSLEACLVHLPLLLAPPPAPPAAAAAGEQLAAVLVLALGACQELSPPALLAALRCTHVALRRRLLVSGARAGGGVAGGAGLRSSLVVELALRLSECMRVVASAACRLQACHVMGMLVESPDAVEGMLLQGAAEVGDGGDDGGGEHDAAAPPPPLRSVCAAISSRLYDAADEVRCATLGLARRVVAMVAMAQPGVATARGAAAAAERLLTEVAQLRDVAPGSAFYGEYHAFRSWAAQHVPPPRP